MKAWIASGLVTVGMAATGAAQAQNVGVATSNPGSLFHNIGTAVANAATGETVGDTSQFVAGADWLAGVEAFDAVLPEVSIQGRVYRNVAFKYPKGN